MLLSKWYLDFTSKDATGFFYIITLQWGILRLGFSGLHFFNEDYILRTFRYDPWKNSTSDTNTISDKNLSQENYGQGGSANTIVLLKNSSLKFTPKSSMLNIVHPQVELRGTWEFRAQSIEHLASPLYQDEKGWADWQILSPCAEVNLEVSDSHGKHRLSGSGYIDFVRVSYPLWKLPFEKIYWGRLHQNGEWLICFYFKAKRETISMLILPHGLIQNISVKCEETDEQKLKSFIWKCPDGEQLQCETSFELEDIPILQRPPFDTILPRQIRNFLSSKGKDRKFRALADWKGKTFEGIMEEVVFGSK